MPLLTLVFFTHGIFASVQDASVDALAISLVPHQVMGRLNAFMGGGFLAGISFGAAVLSTMLHSYNFTIAVCVQSLTLLLFTILTFFIKLDAADPLLPSFSSAKREASQGDNPELKVVFTNLWKGMTDKSSFRIFCIIAGTYTCLSIFIRSFSFYLLHSLKWQDNPLLYYRAAGGAS